METSSQQGSVALSEGDKVLDRYRVDERVAIGGHSVVYRGEDERLARPVCIKVFDKLAADERVWRTAYEHFVQEAFALSRLTHPNTLRIYDFGHISKEGEEVGVPVQVSEYMNGGNLAQLVRKDGPLAVDEAVRVLTTMCDALAEAHGCGIVHRDIKPQNILFGSTGNNRQPKLADFGIAKAFGDEAKVLANKAGDTEVVAGFPMVMYSPSWAAPEQLAGAPAGAAADLYSLAAVGVYTMTGRVVFRAEEVSEGYERRRKADKLIAEAFEPYSAPREGIELLARACSFEVERRPESVARFAADLRAAFNTSKRATTARPRSPEPERLPPVVVTGPSEVIAPAAPKRPPPAPPGARPPVPAVAAPPAAAADGQHAAGSGKPQRLLPSLEPSYVARRRCHFVPTEDGTAVVSFRGARVRVTANIASAGRVHVHVRGLSCFVARNGGRPSSAVTLEKGGEIRLVTPRHEDIARVRVDLGRPAAGHTVFRIDDHDVAIGVSDCPDVVMLDGGAEGECFFVHRAPSEIPGASARRWWRSSSHER